MTLEEAKAILADYMEPTGAIYGSGRYISWSLGDEKACLDSYFTADELEAVTVIMRAMPGATE